MKKLETNESYHSNQAIGSTLLKKIAKKSVLHAVKEEQRESDALTVGSAVHCAILEPERFKTDFIVIPKIDKRTKDGKVLYEQYQQMATGKTILDEDQFKTVEGAVASLKSHAIANGMLTGGEAEYSFYSTDMSTGLETKCRPDYVNQGALIDLKTCADASTEGFTRACANFSYHLQAAYYLDVYNQANGTKLEEFYFVAVETSSPFAVNTFKMGEAEISLGRILYQRALKQYADYLKSPENLNHFGYEEKINEIVFPMWAFDKMA